MKLGKVYYKKFNNRLIKRKFAFFPKILSNHNKIWLETYYSYQEYGPKGIAWAGNHWHPPHGWSEEFSCSTKQELKYKLKIDYLEKKRIQKTSDKFFKQYGYLFT